MKASTRRQNFSRNSLGFSLSDNLTAEELVEFLFTRRRCFDQAPLTVVFSVCKWYVTCVYKCACDLYFALVIYSISRGYIFPRGSFTDSFDDQSERLATRARGLYIIMFGYVEVCFVFLLLFIVRIYFSDCDAVLHFYERFAKKPTKRLRGKIIFITGASSGIG